VDAVVPGSVALKVDFTHTMNQNLAIGSFCRMKSVLATTGIMNHGETLEGKKRRMTMKSLQRRRCRPAEGTFASVFNWVMVAVCAASLCSAMGQTARAGDVVIPQEREIRRLVLQHLRDGDLEQSLKALEAVVDRTGSISVADNDQLFPVCAGLHRVLSALSSEEQYELLFRWTMPEDSPPKIRLLSGLVPTVAPPAEFARIFGERPQASSFPVSSIGDIRGLFCTGWTLVVAARECGKLQPLIMKLESMAEQQVPNAEFLLWLAQLADDRRDMEQLAEQLSQRVNPLRSPRQTTGTVSASMDLSVVVLAAAALHHPQTRPQSEEILSRLLASQLSHRSPFLRSFLRQAHATAVLKNRGTTDVSSLMATPWKYWIPVSEGGANSNALAEATWLVHEDHILHLSGSGEDLLLFRYPLSGQFQFEFETQLDRTNEANGGLVFGGLHFQASNHAGEFDVWGPIGTRSRKRFSPFVRLSDQPMFNHWSVTVTSDQATVAVNRHPIRTDAVEFQSSPWIGLRSSDQSRPLFRNLKLAGQLVIPRSVPLVQGDVLRGWQVDLMGSDPLLTTFEAKNAHDSASATNRKGSDPIKSTIISPGSVWRVADGVIEAPLNRERIGSSVTLEERLSCLRPLLGGESVSYEYFHEPDAWDVSPTLGRLAFLLRPDGVQLHWVTDGENEWSGLTTDNSLAEPLNRRGPEKLPLKVHDWNHVTLARSNDQSLTVSLNGVEIYQRPIDWVGDQRFGFFRDPSAGGVQIRNVVLTGDWPETVPQECFNNPAATEARPHSDADRQAFNRLLREEFLSEDIFNIRRRALAMPVLERFEFLSRWILPGPDHSGFRMRGEFAPTQPAPNAAEPGIDQADLGGSIVSPVFDWLDAAKELDRLTECRQLVAAAAALDDEQQRRSQAALLFLLSLELNDPAAITADGEQFFKLLALQSPLGIADQWPETLASVRGCQRFADQKIVSDLLDDLYTRRTQQSRPLGIPLWHAHIAALYGQLQLPQRDPGAVQGSSLTFNEWIPVSAATASSCGDGYPNLRWQQHDGQVTRISGHGDDFLFFRLPLTGDYEVECDLIQPASQPSQMLLAGTYFGTHADPSLLEVGTFGTRSPFVKLDPPFTSFHFTARYRGVLRNGTRTIFINGRKVQSDTPPDAHDPWIAVRCGNNSLGGVQDLRITGQPRVLDAVPLSSSAGLTGWLPYHVESGEGTEDEWQHVDDPQSSGWIVGRVNPRLGGTCAESLLRYQRPLVEDGSIEYEFFFDPGVVETHPALHRLAFMLTPSGVCEHWITDGRHDRTSLSPDNIQIVPKNRRGPAEIPLRANEWNHLKLTMSGAMVAIELNEQLVYERELEPTNQRSFGLFHFADRYEARVRNAVMRGEWPKALPDIAHQELAGHPVMDQLDADLPRLKSIFSHDFQKDGLPEKYFKVPPFANTARLLPGPDGVQASQFSTGGWVTTEIMPRFSLSGDFDIVAGFTRLQVEKNKGDFGIMLQVWLDEARKPAYGISRLLTSVGRHESHSSVSFEQADATRSWSAETRPNEAVNGRLRIARRGDTIFTLIADENSRIFRLIESEPVSPAGIVRDGVRLQALCAGPGSCRVNWTSVVLRAEYMTFFPETPESLMNQLRITKPDGTGLQMIASSAALAMTHLANPEWSADGRRIVMEISNGSPITSRVVVVNADGQELKDLGPGLSPSFSADGSEIIFCQPVKGMMLMKLDGSGRQVLDPGGTGPQFSPDGRLIVYHKQGDITLMDFATRSTRPFLSGEAADRYTSLGGNVAWSHDSRSVAFKARRRDGNIVDLVVADVDSTEGPTMIYPQPDAVIDDLTWSPDNQQIILSLQTLGTPGPKLHGINRHPPGPPQPLSAQPLDYKVTGLAWSRDGKWLALTTQHISKPIEWTTIENADSE